MQGTESYAIEVDKIDRNAWAEILGRFSDAAVFQTWAYGVERCGEPNLSHLILRCDGSIVAAAQVMLLRAPLVGWGAAFIHWGPMWRVRGEPPNTQHLAAMLKALRDEYATKRGMLLRIATREFDDEPIEISKMMETEGLIAPKHVRPRKTILLDLDRSLDELRKNISHGWRQSLNRAERANLEVRILTDDSVCTVFPELFGEMHRRQKFVGGDNIDPVMNVQRTLPEELKTRFFICYYEGRPVAGLGCSLIGETAFCWVAAASHEGLHLNAANLVWWRAVEHAKAQGFRMLDLGGSDEVNVPGPTRFKRMLAGKNYVERQFAGPFEVAGSAASYYTIHWSEWLREHYFAAKAFVNRIVLRDAAPQKSKRNLPGSPPDHEP